MSLPYPTSNSDVSVLPSIEILESVIWQVIRTAGDREEQLFLS